MRYCATVILSATLLSGCAHGAAIASEVTGFLGSIDTRRLADCASRGSLREAASCAGLSVASDLAGRAVERLGVLVERLQQHNDGAGAEGPVLTDYELRAMHREASRLAADLCEQGADLCL